MIATEERLFPEFVRCAMQCRDGLTTSGECSVSCCRCDVDDRRKGYTQGVGNMISYSNDLSDQAD
jgi:hypothetical protein